MSTQVVTNGAAPPPVVVTPAKPKPASKLKAVAPKAAEPSKPKILIFGKPGVGKTWASLDFPSVYYIDTEGGADLGHYTDKLTKAGGMYFGIEQGSLSFDAVLEQIQALATEDHGYKTVVIDSITKLFNLEVSKEGDRLGDKNAFGADKKPAISYMRKLVSWLTRLDMNVIMIAHEKPLWGIDAKGERAEIGVTFDCWDKLEYELHLCLNIMKQGGSHKARVRKSRLTGFPDATVFDWSYAVFAEKYGKDIMEKQAVAIQLATPEQLAEVDRLLEKVRLSDTDRKDKWLTENRSNLAELESRIIEDVLNHLKGKLA
jgi:hypothetical protein